MHDIANCKSRSGKQSAQSTNKEDGDADQLGSPGMRRGCEIGSEAQVESGNHDQETGPEILFPSSLEHSSKNKNASNRAEQTNNKIQEGDDEPTNQLTARPSPDDQILE